ncbi:MAG: UPF0182 family protein [Actinomycetota bacterium]|nr:UPF0182 family protein [Actinomycetota bacterium]
MAAFVLFASLQGIARFYTDYLWFDSLGLSSVWRSVLGARVVLGLLFTAIFFVLAWVNLFIADRLAPRFRPAGPEEELLERYHEVVGARTGLVRAAVALVFAVIAGAGVSQRWESWILFTNRVDFGEEDALFGVDIGFYVFQLPFLGFLVSWLFAAFVIILIITAVAHYLNGGIRLQASGQRVTPQVKAHLSVLLGVLALVNAGGYWLDRYELTLSTRGTVDGATYTDVNAQLPAINLLLLISLFAFGLFIYNILRKGWVLPVLAVGLWAFVAIVAGSAYPAFIQRFRVEPNESTRELEYIDRNIAATRAAYAVGGIDPANFAANEDLTAEDLIDNEETIRNIRLLDPSLVNDTYQRLQAERGFYQFPGDLDVDRYEIDGQTTQVVLAARELNTGGIESPSWENQRLTYTHGYGVALAAANAVAAGRPDFLVGGVPIAQDPTIEDSPEFELSSPQLYFSEGLDGYAIVNTEREELDYLDSDGTNVFTSFTHEGGVSIGSLVRQVAFALRFGDIDPLISANIGSESRVMYIRSIRDRVETVAPFLHYDSDPYPVIHDGRIVYMMDAYTTSDNYPYSQGAINEDLPSGSGLNHSFNYVRNSVKVVVDGFDGDIDMYLVEDQSGDVDPIAQAYANAFPDLFSEWDELPEGLRDHIRYPEDLFRVQTNMWGSYHIDDAVDFYQQTAAWAVAQDPGTGVATAITQTTAPDGTPAGTRERRIDPQYLLMRLPEESEESFLLLRSFVPESGNDQLKELTAFMVAKSDWEEYGQLQVYEVPSTGVDGPALVASEIESNTEIAQEITLLDQQGSQVRRGNLLLIPIEESILWVRPLYVEASNQTAVPELEKVIAVFGDEIVMEDTLEQALQEIFGEAPETLEDPDAAPSGEEEGSDVPLPDTGSDDEDEDDEDTPPTTSETGETTPTTEGGTPGVGSVPADSTDVNELVADAQALFDAADDALADGNLAEYAELVDAARDRLRQIEENLPEDEEQASAGS